MSKLKKSLKTIYYVILTFLIIIAVLLMGSVLPIPGNYSVKLVESGSMEPAIKTGSVVMTKPFDDYKIGDIICFGEDSRIKTPTTHRIYDMEVIEGKPYYVTKGDANNAPDQKKVEAGEIIGKVLIDIPYLGYVVSEARKPLGFMLIIIIPATVIVYDELRKIWQEIKKLKDKKKDQQQDKRIKELEDKIEK
ncbi:MAG: hypothetical protein AVO34_01820 [Firmicutes bacterium ML8_F2]|jgi:signal peptidase I|nr:MAG: hypothetical protein AVO34_01820 [Firmicutes bacterium ML8_F2]